VRAIESKRVPQQGMSLHMRQMLYPLGYYLILRDSGGETLGVWELLWHT
jgi:predicted enzyme related to lactoylglutathione lyase